MPYKSKNLRIVIFTIIFCSKVTLHNLQLLSKGAKMAKYFCSSRLSSSLPNHFRSFCRKSNLTLLQKTKNYFFCKCSGNDLEKHNLGFKKTHHGFVSSKFSHFMKMTRKAANLASHFVQFNHVLYACTSTFWVVIGCEGPIWIYQDHLS
jgi:hypothetical protein